MSRINLADLIDIIDSTSCREYNKAKGGELSKVDRPASKRKAVPCPSRPDTVSKTIRQSRIRRYMELAEKEQPLFDGAKCVENASNKS